MGLAPKISTQSGPALANNRTLKTTEKESVCRVLHGFQLAVNRKTMGE